MAILNPEHLFEQAAELVAHPRAGAPRQVDIRRAMSAAYYGIFHAVASAAADEFVGVTLRSTSQYGLVYRSVDHGRLAGLCDDLKRPNLPARYSPYLPVSGVGPNIVAFAIGVVELQEKRHSADYDPMIRVKTSDALLAIKTARAALNSFDNASSERKKAFLGLLLFSPRR